MGKAYNLHLGFTHVYFSRVPVVLFYLVGVYYALLVLADFAKDTTAITNVAFGIAVAFSSLSFRWSSVISDSPEDKERIAYCGERFLHASLLLVIASVIKYVVVAIGPVPVGSITHLSEITWRYCVTFVFGVSVLFLYALAFAHTGVVFINRILWRRVVKYQDWDSWA